MGYPYWTPPRQGWEPRSSRVIWVGKKPECSESALTQTRCQGRANPPNPGQHVQCLSGCLKRIEAEVIQQGADQLAVLFARFNHTEPRVVMLRVDIFMAPQAGRGQVDCLALAGRARNFQTQLEIHIDHHGQLADQHQPTFRNVAQKTDRFIGNSVEYLQEAM